MSDVPPPPLPYAAPVMPMPESVSTADVPRQLAAAEAAWRPIGRAVRYATFDAWTLAVFAALSLPCAIGGVVGILLALVLGGCAYVEFTGVARLKRLDPAAPRRLAVNQLVLAAAVVLYCGWNLVAEATGHGMSAQLNAHISDLGDLGPQAVDMTKSVVYGLYATLAVVGGAVPAATAWFYASRSAAVRTYLADTPPWIVQMQRERGRL